MQALRGGIAALRLYVWVRMPACTWGCLTVLLLNQGPRSSPQLGPCGNCSAAGGGSVLTEPRIAGRAVRHFGGGVTPGQTLLNHAAGVHHLHGSTAGSVMLDALGRPLQGCCLQHKDRPRLDGVGPTSLGYICVTSGGPLREATISGTSTQRSDLAHAAGQRSKAEDSDESSCTPPPPPPPK